jgi:site-specific DNA-cytosine methylase
LKAPTFIDLFSGGGGFTLGMLRAGFDCKAAVVSTEP